MNLEIRTSTIFVFIITQTLLSILFYMDDHYITGKEAIIIFLLSIPLTFGIQWIRGLNRIKEDQDK